MNTNKQKNLRLITPILTALSMFILAAIWGNITKLSDKMDNVGERVAALEAQVRILLK